MVWYCEAVDMVRYCRAEDMIWYSKVIYTAQFSINVGLDTASKIWLSTVRRNVRLSIQFILLFCTARREIGQVLIDSDNNTCDRDIAECKTRYPKIRNRHCYTENMVRCCTVEAMDRFTKQKYDQVLQYRRYRLVLQDCRYCQVL